MSNIRKVTVAFAIVIVLLVAAFAAAAAPANLEHARAADAARWNGAARAYSAAELRAAGTRNMPHPGLYRFFEPAASALSVRGMPHPGLYKVFERGASVSGVRGMPHPGLYQLWVDL